MSVVDQGTVVSVRELFLELTRVEDAIRDTRQHGSVSELVELLRAEDVILAALQGQHARTGVN